MQHNEDNILLWHYTLPLQQHKQGMLPSTVLLASHNLPVVAKTEASHL